jgi:hypothetical protein
MATKTQGTTLTWHALPVGEVTNVSGLSSPTTKIDIGSFADTVVKTRPGIRKTGTFVFDVNFNQDNTTYIAIEADRATGTERTVVLVAPSGTVKTVTFTAVCLNSTITGKVNDIYKGQITLRVTSKPERS